MTENKDATPRRVGLQEVTSVTWIDDDGTRYRRTINNGEIVDQKIKNSHEYE